MAYVPSFEHDVFISYAHADNHDKRVTEFRDRLVQRLTSVLGSRAFHEPDKWVFFDETRLRLGDEFSPKLERAAQRSAVMISLLSNSYLQARWCIKETEWFEEAMSRARDPIERKLIPINLDLPNTDSLEDFPRFHGRLRGDFNNPGIITQVANEIAQHLTDARKKHGFVYLGQPCASTKEARRVVADELRGFDCGPVHQVFGYEEVVKRKLAEAKIAVHFLGDDGYELPHGADPILWSIEHCPGKTIGYLPRGCKLQPAEREAIESVRNHERWSMPECTPTELVQILTQELESFRFPDPVIPIALACARPDLPQVREIAREIHVKERGAFAVATPDFLENPQARAQREWQKHMTQNRSALVYWGEGEKVYLDSNIALYQKAARYGCAWYVAGAVPESKEDWQPQLEIEKIRDKEQPFDFEKVKDFLRRVKEKARQ